MTKAKNPNMNRVLATLVDDDRNLIDGLAGKKAYTLLSDASTTGDPISSISGGSYIWRIEGVWGGAAATLQMLGLDGSTWKTVLMLNGTNMEALSDSSMELVIGQDAILRVKLDNATASTKLNSVLAGF